jgi:predicted transposase YbfD/YdcC
MHYIPKKKSPIILLKRKRRTIYSQHRESTDSIGRHQERCFKKNSESTPDYETLDKGHDRIEIRRIWVSHEPGIYDCCDFPLSQQFFMVERDVTRKQRGNESHTLELTYGVTSLKLEQASAKRLLELNREHWEIENRVHYVRDVIYDEDRCRIRTGNGARMMASIRNTAISLVRMMGFRYIPDANRAFTFCSNRKEVFAMWGIW